MRFLDRYIHYLGKSAEGEIEETVFNFLPRGKQIVYLDLGCGDGSKTIRRATRIGTSKFSGIEIERIETLGSKGKIRIYSADLNHKLPVRGRSVDCITLTEVIEHLVDLDNFFSEVKRILKPNGKLIISTENLASCHNIMALLLGNQPYTGPYLSRIYPIGSRNNAKYYTGKNKGGGNPHINGMTIKALTKLLERNGFQIKAVAGIAFYPLPPVLGKLISKVDKYHSTYCVVSAENQ